MKILHVVFAAAAVGAINHVQADAVTEAARATLETLPFCQHFPHLCSPAQPVNGGENQAERASAADDQEKAALPDCARWPTLCKERVAVSSNDDEKAALPDCARWPTLCKERVAVSSNDEEKAALPDCARWPTLCKQ